MKTIRIALLAFFTVFLFSSCSKTFNCTCYLFDKKAGIENGTQVIRMDIKSLNGKKRAEKNCEQHEASLTSEAQSANCNL